MDLHINLRMSGKAIGRPWRILAALLVPLLLASGCAPHQATSRNGLEATRSLGHPRTVRPDRSIFDGLRQRPAEVPLIAGRQPAATPLYTDRGETVTLNLVDVPVKVAANAIFTEILKVNFILDDDVEATVTLQTSSPVSKQALVDSFQSVLSTKGVAITKVGDIYRLSSASDALITGGLPVQKEGDIQIGRGARVVTLQAISALEMARILAPIAPSGVLRADPKRNVLVLGGTNEEIRSMQDAIRLFDVDWMRGMSAAIFPLSGGGNPAGLTRQLEELFGGKEGPLEGAIRFIPSNELNAILVIASNRGYLDRARIYIEKMDRLASSNVTQTFVYKVENRPAKELAAIVQGMIAGESGPASLAPSLAELRTSIDAGAEGEGEMSDTAEGDDATTSFTKNRMTVVADEPNNSLVIIATKAEYDRLLPILSSSDRMANQVLIEAVIAEVTLNDELQFGLRWFFETSNGKAKLTDAASGAIASIAPGFSYFFSDVNFQVVLNALSSVTDVKVISSPTLTVLDNRTARLQIGDQVPIVTQTASSVQTAADAPIVNKVEMKDTGVILSVTPRVNSNGHVLLNIEQEVSDVVRTTSSGIDSPTIRQRKIATTVVVEDGQSIALGGLVQEKRERGTEAVPVLGNIPVLGAAFRNRSSRAIRTELVIFIRPRVMRNGAEAEAVTSEFRDNLSRLGLDAGRGDNEIQRIAR